MFVIIGMVIVVVSVVAGYLMEHGNLSVLFQPAEVVIIGGAAVGAFLIAAPLKIIKAVAGSFSILFGRKALTKADYLDVLTLLNNLFYKIRQQGLVSVESDVDDPHESPLFSKHPQVLKNHHALNLVTDTLRTVMTTTIAPHELESLLDNELEAHHEESLSVSHMITFIADALPGLGIVAAVLGVVLTMGKINEPPEVLGHSIGAALVGTFLGVLLCYGFVGPIGKNLEHVAADELLYLNVFKVALLSFIGGAAPKVAVEFARRVVPGSAKPSFLELEENLRQNKTK
jgi:chemotaxis protein MotA